MKVWQEILPRIEFFFRRAVVPELFTRRVQRGEKLYQIVQFIKKHYFAHEYLLNGELIGITYLRFFMFYGSHMNLN